MPKYRNDLPQLGDTLFLTDSGLETTLIFHDGMELPHFASFDLLKTAAGRKRLRDYYELHARTAVENRMGFVLESVTWRANPDWAKKLGYDARSLAFANRDAIDMLVDIRREFETPASPMVISGNLGPRGDGYDPGRLMSAAEAEDYHCTQIDTLSWTEADFISGFTINNVPEAVGIVRAAKRLEVPSVISFTLETDGRLPTGQTLQEAIETTDAETGGAAAYFMINCAHPTHFEDALKANAAWTQRIRGLRANASRRSHAELDSSPDLDAGDPIELGRQYRDLRRSFGHLTMLGGCCGTDHRHVREIARFCSSAEALA
ncbi:homocysteine S-methyltransferase family protein [Flaviflagellibacter deserti]|uniref:Homocysteine S-methyltransferase family protein n=1 Tax=Flaviflagellibacter deserti TaxID=2267266 RepID=A0ABV9Z5E5_9HYPH